MFEDNENLDNAATRLAGLADRLLKGGVKDALQGKWLGHPLHPMLTDIPIGCFTSALVLDLFGGRRARPSADGLIALGIASAVPTAAAGLADWTDLGRRGRRVGIVHAAANATGLVLYAWSLSARLRGHRIRGLMLGVAGASAMTAGGYLGGHLAFGLEEEPADAATEAQPPLPTLDPTPPAEVAISK
jgi:uncharacterized membrane protein